MRLRKIANKKFLKPRPGSGKSVAFSFFGNIGRTISTIDVHSILFLSVVSKCAWAKLQTKTFWKHSITAAKALFFCVLEASDARFLQRSGFCECSTFFSTIATFLKWSAKWSTLFEVIGNTIGTFWGVGK